MGNLMAESSMKSNIAQRGMTELTDEEYTAKFDSEPMACYRDGVGYGLAQWTFWSRKKALYEFAAGRAVSVADEDMQAEFIVHELHRDFPELFSFLCQTVELYAATDRVCREYEKPAVRNVDRRFEFALDFDRSMRTDKSKVKRYPPDQSILILQAVLVYNGYNTEISGYKNKDFLQKLREFTEDLGA